jgi:hypothetical protein
VWNASFYIIPGATSRRGWTLVGGEGGGSIAYALTKIAIDTARAQVTIR